MNRAFLKFFRYFLSFLMAFGLIFVFLKGISAVNDTKLTDYRDLSPEIASFSADLASETPISSRSTSKNSHFNAQNEQFFEKSAYLALEVANIEESVALVKYEVAILDGFIVNLSANQLPNARLSYHLRVKVPEEELENLLLALEKLGEKQTERFSARDVTEELQNRALSIENLKIYQKSLQTLLEQQSDNLDSLLKINKELQNVQLQLDRAEKTQKNQQNRVKMAFLDLDLRPEPQADDILEEKWSISRIWKETKVNFIASMRLLVEWSFQIIAYFPIWGTLGVILLIFWSFFRKKS